MLVRAATYADDPERLPAELALERVRLALRGVFYVDGGWATIVSRLLDEAARTGVEVRRDARAVSVVEDGAGERVILAQGGPVRATSVLLALGPREAASLTGDAALLRFADAAVPVKAAMLDVGLSSLPDPARAVVLGIDEPLYLSAHSKFAKLAPEGAATIHVMRYLGARGPSSADEKELERLLDLAQPGWRERVVVRRFLSAMTVAHALPIAGRGGLAERPAPAVPGRPGLFLAGDWVGGAGWLMDASVASAAQASRLALARRSGMDVREPARELRAAS
jgi:phytoene dehydrogenase-like protein